MSEGLADKCSASPFGSGSASTLVSCLEQLCSSQGSKQAAGCRLKLHAARQGTSDNLLRSSSPPHWGCAPVLVGLTVGLLIPA